MRDVYKYQNYQGVVIQFLHKGVQRKVFVYGTRYRQILSFGSYADNVFTTSGVKHRPSGR